MASGIAVRLHSCHFNNILMLETPWPMAVRRTVSFCEAVQEGFTTVEGVQAVRVNGVDEVHRAWRQQNIAVAVDPEWTLIEKLKPDVVIDAILAKKNLGTSLQDAPLVIGCGPGFEAGADVHRIVETQRGHDLGRVIETGEAISDTGIPGEIGGYTVERLLRAERDGVFESEMSIGSRVEKGQIIGHVEREHVTASIPGILRGLIRPETPVRCGLKIGDIDPRAKRNHCFSVSDKARAIGGGVLECILRE